MAVNAIVLCGAENSGPLRDVDPAPNEGLITIGGRPMVQYVLDGLRQSSRIGRILLVAPPDVVGPRVHGDGIELVPPTGHIIDNVMAAVRRLPGDQKVLIATSDIPLITGRVIDGFLDLCSAREADLYYPVVERSVAEAQYSGVRRTYVHLREGTFTGGNLFLANPAIADAVAPRIRAFLDQRKHPVRMAAILGWGFVLRLALRTLSLYELERKISELWGVRGAVIVCPYPEVGIDVDKPSDLELARVALTGLSG